MAARMTPLTGNDRGPAGTDSIPLAEINAVPLLSIIIPTLNEAHTLPLLAIDLSAQQDINLEVLVADGGSTDATRAAAEAEGWRFVPAPRGRGAQMNAAARLASSDWLLFLHADSRLPDPLLLRRALTTVGESTRLHGPTAGHFRLRFRRTTTANRLSYRYIEAKTALNRTHTTNGDQGFLLGRDLFNRLGGFDQGLPFLEDQRLAERIRNQARWITLPGTLETSARRFEAEGFHRRYLLMGMIMGMHALGMDVFFERAHGVYRLQAEADRLQLSPFFALIRSMIRHDWGLVGTMRVFFQLGRYLRENAWQLFFFLDVCLRPLIGSDQAPLLRLHDRFLARFLACRPVDTLAGLFCFIWYLGVLAPIYALIEEQPFSRSGKTHHG
jgi:rSAM/selenodomain-associated transferase 2